MSNVVLFFFTSLSVRISHPLLITNSLFPYSCNAAGGYNSSFTLVNPAYVSNSTFEITNIFHWGPEGLGSMTFPFDEATFFRMDGAISTGYGVPLLSMAFGDQKRSYSINILNLEKTILVLEHEVSFHLDGHDTIPIVVTNLDIPELPEDVSIDATAYIDRVLNLDNKIGGRTKVNKTKINFAYGERKDNFVWGGGIFVDLLSFQNQLSYSGEVYSPEFRFYIVNNPGSDWTLNLKGKTYLLYQTYFAGGDINIDISKFQIGINVGTVYEGEGWRVGGALGQCLPGVVSGKISFSSTYSKPVEGSLDLKIEGVDVDYENKTVTGEASLYVKDVQTVKRDSSFEGSSSTFPSTVISTGLILESSPFSMGFSLRFKGNIVKLTGEELLVSQFIGFKSKVDIFFSAGLEFFRDQIGWGLGRITFPSLYYGIGFQKKVSIFSFSLSFSNSSDVSVFKSFFSGRSVPFPHVIAAGITINK